MECAVVNYELPVNAVNSLEISDLANMLDEGISTPDSTVIMFNRMIEDLDYEKLTEKKIRAICRKFRTYGFKIGISGNKSQLFNNLQTVNENEKVQILAFRPADDRRKRIVTTWPRLTLQKLSQWGDMGILSDVLGQKSQVNDNGSIQDMSTNNILSREWIDSIYSDSSQAKTWKKPRNVARGQVRSVNRNICNKNAKFIKGEEAKPRCINLKTKDASFAALGTNYCPNCNGLATKPTWRFGGSSVNAKFAPCLIMKPNGLMLTEAKIHEDIDGNRYPKIGMVHKQKIGGRHSVKIDGKTNFYSGSFVKTLYPMGTSVDGVSDWVSVWVFIMNDNQSRVDNHNPFIANVRMENTMNQINQITRVQKNHTGAV